MVDKKIVELVDIEAQHDESSLDVSNAGFAPNLTQEQEARANIAWLHAYLMAAASVIQGSFSLAAITRALNELRFTLAPVANPVSQIDVDGNGSDVEANRSVDSVVATTDYAAVAYDAAISSGKFLAQAPTAISLQRDRAWDYAFPPAPLTELDLEEISEFLQGNFKAELVDKIIKTSSHPFSLQLLAAFNSAQGALPLPLSLINFRAITSLPLGASLSIILLSWAASTRISYPADWYKIDR